MSIPVPFPSLLPCPPPTPYSIPKDNFEVNSLLPPWVPGIKPRSSVRLPGKSLAAEPSLRLVLCWGFFFFGLFICLPVCFLGKTQLFSIPCPCLEFSLHFVSWTSFHPSGQLKCAIPGKAFWSPPRLMALSQSSHSLKLHTHCETHSHLLPPEVYEWKKAILFQVIKNTDAHWCLFFKQPFFCFVLHYLSSLQKSTVYLKSAFTLTTESNYICGIHVCFYNI